MLGFLRVARPIGSGSSTCESVKSVRLFAQDGFELRKGGCGRSLLKQHFAVKFTGRRQRSWRDDAFLGLVFCIGGAAQRCKRLLPGRYRAHRRQYPVSSAPRSRWLATLPAP